MIITIGTIKKKIKMKTILFMMERKKEEEEENLLLIKVILFICLT